MSTKNSRKLFLAQLLGVCAGIGLVPKLFARRISPAAAPVSPIAPFAVQPEPRAVARADDAGGTHAGT